MDKLACTENRFTVFEHVKNRKFFLAITRGRERERRGGERVPSAADIRYTGVSYLPVVLSIGLLVKGKLPAR